LLPTVVDEVIVLTIRDLLYIENKKKYDLSSEIMTILYLLTIAFGKYSYFILETIHIKSTSVGTIGMR